MSNYAASVLAKGQAIISDKMQAPEMRRKTPNVLGLALKNQEFSIPNAAELRVSPLRPVEITYFNNVAAGTATAKSYNHTGALGDNSVIQLNYVTHVETITMPNKLADGNFASYQQIFNTQYQMKWKNLIDRHDNSALSFLLANKMQLSAAVINPQIASANPGVYNEANHALEVSADDKKMLMQRIKSYLAARLYGGNLDVVTDLQLAAAFSFAAQQGAGNFESIAYQLDNTVLAVTAQQIDSAYGNGSVLALPQGMFACLNWNEGLNKRGLNKDQGGPVGTFGTIVDPFGLGIYADVSMYTRRADTSSNTTGGSTQDVVDEWELTITNAYCLPPFSTANESVVHEIGQL